ncbi:nucleoside 2-deoxyribosyltransferase [Rhizobium sp. KVB221]|uniref:Nucleoside 2-deoxyribosyltransferase n=1 Tax=Rhizobium setariae TaxID=2801340 RepID=A0A937CPE1_9HYPH|nr:nucleoside 2-deoxyribosyltransferase [Rhizobium setariae]MBL0373089.1 nucleoside 2-deoxyribosyltransferase [Rhizobium setariae]
MTLKIYTAGPEVFLANAREVMAAKTALCRKYGFDAICPGDLDIPPAETMKAFGLAISRVDEDMMDSADAVIANLTPFRGLAADVGTAFELGYMCAQGKLVAAYTNVTEDHYQRTLAYYGGQISTDAGGYKRGPDGLSLEDFDMIDNLMLHGGVERRGGAVVVHKAADDALYTDLTGFEACLKALAEQIRHQSRDEGRRPEDLDASNDD